MLLDIVLPLLKPHDHVSYAIAPLLAMGLISAIPSIVKGVSGARQAAAAKKAEKNLKQPRLNLPEYKIPGQVTDVTKRVKMAGIGQQLPGADLIKGQIDADTATAIKEAQRSGASSGDVLATIASMTGKGSQMKRDVAYRGIERQDQMLSDINRALMTEAGYEDKKQGLNLDKYLKEFEYNVDQPYKSQVAEISALRGAANQNIYGAVNDLASLGTSLAMQGALGRQAAPATSGGTGFMDTTSVSEMPADVKAKLYPPQVGPPTYAQFMSQRSAAPAAGSQFAGGVPYNTAGMGAGRLSNEGFTSAAQPAAQTTYQQSMMGMYGQPAGSTFNYITGVPSASLAPFKPSWYNNATNPYWMYNYAPGPGAPYRNLSGAPYAGQ